jgi:pyruvoyl-dependent arginine decarboxylase (PvlArgDC)
MFRASQRPSSRVPKTVFAISGIGHSIGTATSFHRGLNQATVEGSSGTNT